MESIKSEKSNVMKLFKDPTIIVREVPGEQKITGGSFAL